MSLPMFSSLRAVRVLLACAVLLALPQAPAFAAVDPARAQALFQEAAQLCGHDANFRGQGCGARVGGRAVFHDRYSTMYEGKLQR